MPAGSPVDTPLERSRKMGGRENGMQEPTDMNIVLVLEDYHFSRLDVFDKPNLVDFYKSGLRRMR